jgi:uncharacterized protein YukE
LTGFGIDEKRSHDTMTMEGMDVGEVESLGHQLMNQGNTIQTVINAIDGIVNTMESVWKGPDATEFMGWWQSQHRPALENAESAVHGLGQSALNNAKQQIDASGMMTAGVLAGAGVAVGGAAVGASAVSGSGQVGAGSAANAAQAGAMGAGLSPETRQAIVNTAQGKLGGGWEPAYQEAAPTATPGEWCGGFVTWALKKNGVSPKVADPGYVYSWLDAAKTPGSGVVTTSHPEVGDVVVWPYSAPPGGGHMGIVTNPSLTGGGFQSISGNFASKVAITPSGGAGQPYASLNGGSYTWEGTYYHVDPPIFLKVT